MRYNIDRVHKQPMQISRAGKGRSEVENRPANISQAQNHD